MDTKYNKNTSENLSLSYKVPNYLGVRIYSTILIIVDILIFFAKFCYEILQSTIRLIIEPKLKSMDGEVVLITGTGHGIGKELALQYSALGCKVVCIDINEATNAKTVDEINSRFPKNRAYPYRCDMTNRQSVLDLSKQILADVGKVTTIVNNAGIMPCHQLTQHSEAEIRRIFDINVFAHYWVVEAFLPQMIERGTGHIVALSSMAGLIGFTNLVPYCGSKFAVRGMMEALYEELKENPKGLNIGLTTVFPYMVDTGLCKKPKIRFPSLFGLLPPHFVAAQIIRAQRLNLREVTVPRYMYSLHNAARVLPDHCAWLFKNFIDSGVESDL